MSKTVNAAENPYSLRTTKIANKIGLSQIAMFYSTMKFHLFVAILKLVQLHGHSGFNASQ